MMPSAYKNKKIIRLGRGSKAFQTVDKINRYLLENLPKRNPYAERQIKEGENDDERLQSKNAQLQHLKDRLRIEAGKNQNLRNQIKVFKNR